MQEVRIVIVCGYISEVVTHPGLEGKVLKV